MKKYYSVKTQKDYNQLMAELEKSNCRWGESLKLPTEKNHWEAYKEETVVEVDKSKKKIFFCGQTVLCRL